MSGNKEQMISNLRKLWLNQWNQTRLYLAQHYPDQIGPLSMFVGPEGAKRAAADCDFRQVLLWPDTPRHQSERHESLGAGGAQDGAEQGMARDAHPAAGKGHRTRVNGKGT